jgi:hypothetical protein
MVFVEPGHTSPNPHYFNAPGTAPFSVQAEESRARASAKSR